MCEEHAMIEAENLSKRYQDTWAVRDLSFTARPGMVTGLLGARGAGKSTAMRLLLGIDRPDSGRALMSGRPYRDLTQPLSVVGALPDTPACHAGLSPYNRLCHLAEIQGMRPSRVGAVLSLVGLGSVANMRGSGVSRGMAQRLRVGAAMLGDPSIVILDEPTEGMDVTSVRWTRLLMRQLADQGPTVLLSSHLMSEMAVTADHLLVIVHGELVADCSVTDFVASTSAKSSVLVRTAEGARLTELTPQPASLVDAIHGSAA